LLRQTPIGDHLGQNQRHFGMVHNVAVSECLYFQALYAPENSGASCTPGNAELIRVPLGDCEEIMHVIAQVFRSSLRRDGGRMVVVCNYGYMAKTGHYGKQALVFLAQISSAPRMFF
jgi:phenylacetate-coenzyme A ligase PaaK-like adenylate-forming protein